MSSSWCCGKIVQAKILVTGTGKYIRKSILSH
jgi:hypothetical protein